MISNYLKKAVRDWRRESGLSEVEALRELVGCISPDLKVVPCRSHGFTGTDKNGRFEGVESEEKERERLSRLVFRKEVSPSQSRRLVTLLNRKTAEILAARKGRLR